MFHLIHGMMRFMRMLFQQFVYRMMNLQSLKCSLQLLPALLLFTVTSYAQTTFKTEFAGQTINLVIPYGYCVIPQNTKQGKPFYDLQAKGNSSINIVAVIFADCEEWKHHEADGSYTLNRTGNYLFQLTEGKQALVPKGTTRFDYIKLVTGTDFSMEDKLESTVNTKIAKTGTKTGTIKDINLGVVEADENAVYFAMVSTIKYQNEEVSLQIGGTIAMTIINLIPTSMNIYDVYQGKAGLVNQIRVQQQVVRALIKENSDGTNNSTR
jgi:hypothetical protein